jgi:hypothetical protein
MTFKEQAEVPSNVISLQTARELIGSGSIDGKRLPLIAFMEAQQAEIERLRAALKEFREAEWMVTHDWGGDRPELLDRVDAALAHETPEPSRSVQRRIAAQRGEPAPEFGNETGLKP